MSPTLPTLPTNKRLNSYEDRTELMRDVAAYETGRIAALVPSGVADPSARYGGADSFDVEVGDDGSVMTFVRIEPSTYIEGYTPELKRRILEIPNRSGDLQLFEKMLDNTRAGRVSVSYPYYMSTTIVTNRMFASFVRETGYETLVSRHRTGWHVDGRAQWREGIANSFLLQPWPLSAPDRPVTLVSWFDAASFALRLSEKHGMTFRLPTVEEYVLAARPDALKDEPCLFPWGNDFDTIDRRMNFATRELADHHWVYDQYADGHAGTSPVTEYPPNERGLYDMVGNVWVWNHTSDRNFSALPAGSREASVSNFATLGVGENQPMSMRGGCYLARLTHANLHSRMCHPAVEGACDIGFRLVAVDRGQSGW